MVAVMMELPHVKEQTWLHRSQESFDSCELTLWHVHYHSTQAVYSLIVLGSFSCCVGPIQLFVLLVWVHMQSLDSDY